MDDKQRDTARPSAGRRAFVTTVVAAGLGAALGAGAAGQKVIRPRRRIAIPRRAQPAGEFSLASDVPPVTAPPPSGTADLRMDEGRGPTPPQPASREEMRRAIGNTPSGRKALHQSSGGQIGPVTPVRKPPKRPVQAGLLKIKPHPL